MSNDDLRNHPAVVAANKLGEELDAEARAADADPNYEFDPETYIMPSSMMRGVQIAPSTGVIGTPSGCSQAGRSARHSPSGRPMAGRPGRAVS